MASVVEKGGIQISAEVDEAHLEWIVSGAQELEKRLPFEPPADITLVLGSGLNPVVDNLQLRDPVVIPDEEIGLTVGKVEGHKGRWVAGVAPNGQGVLIKDGRTHAYEPPLLGIETEWGRLSSLELATAYLRIWIESELDI